MPNMPVEDVYLFLGGGGDKVNCHTFFLSRGLGKKKHPFSHTVPPA